MEKAPAIAPLPVEIQNAPAPAPLSELAGSANAETNDAGRRAGTVIWMLFLLLSVVGALAWLFRDRLALAPRIPGTEPEPPETPEMPTLPWETPGAKSVGPPEDPQAVLRQIRRRERDLGGSQAERSEIIDAEFVELAGNEEPP